MLSDFGRAHAEMAKAQRHQLAGDRARLAGDTAALMGELQAESASVASAWRAMPATGARLPAAEAGPGEWLPAAKVKEAPAARVEAAPVAEEEEEIEAEHVGDDLTAIRGIGRGTQQHLKKAGIYTLAQLAASTPEELRQALGTVRGRLANVEEWIEQARELSK
jgi:predicted flap endonuclease-1-like 5' DNA nuclease